MRQRAADLSRADQCNLVACHNVKNPLRIRENLARPGVSSLGVSGFAAPVQVNEKGMLRMSVLHEAAR
jgi:hypothetical protein